MQRIISCAGHAQTNVYFYTNRSYPLTRIFRSDIGPESMGKDMKNRRTI